MRSRDSQVRVREKSRGRMAFWNPSAVASVAERMTRKRQSGVGTWNLPLTLAKPALTFNLTRLTFPASQPTGQRGAPPRLQAPCTRPAANKHPLHVPQWTSKSPREGVCGGHPRSVRCGPGRGACVGGACAEATPSCPVGWPLTWKGTRCILLSDQFTASSGALSPWTWSCWSPWKQKLCSPRPLLFLSLLLLPLFFLSCPHTHSLLSSLYFPFSIFILH